MEGIGNDYVYVNCLERDELKIGRSCQKGRHRHFGIGSTDWIPDQTLLEADALRWICIIPTVLRGAMCGNGIRWRGQSMFMTMDLQIKMKSALRQKSGIKYVKLQVENGK